MDVFLRSSLRSAGDEVAWIASSAVRCLFRNIQVLFSSYCSPLLQHLLDPDLVCRSLLLLYKSNTGPYFFPQDTFISLVVFFFPLLLFLLLLFALANETTHTWLSLAPAFSCQCFSLFILTLSWCHLPSKIECFAICLSNITTVAPVELSSCVIAILHFRKDKCGACLFVCLIDGFSEENIASE